MIANITTNALLIILVIQVSLILAFVSKWIIPIIESTRPIIEDFSESKFYSKTSLTEISVSLREINEKLGRLGHNEITAKLDTIDGRLFIDIPRAIEESHNETSLSKATDRISDDLDKLHHSLGKKLDEIANYLCQISIK